MSVSIPKQRTDLSRLKLFLALSRTPHGLLDLSAPALGALLWLGHFPPTSLIFLGLVTAFAGYTAVYALNDLIDYPVDKEKTKPGGISDAEGDLDALLVRHPLALGLLSLREGFLWTAAWGLLAVIGAYLLNPICVLIFVMACLLESVYCLMLRASHLRTIVSGAVKTSGAVAAIFAVDPDPSPAFLMVLFFWLFFWEIGGQNIPNDWSDIHEDREIEAKTIPVRYGPQRANLIILAFLILTIALSVALFRFTRPHFESPFVMAFLAAGFYFLIIPACRLFRSKDRAHALALFNRASYYPLALLAVVIVKPLI